MQSEEWQDLVYNAGYNDAMSANGYKESFNEQMRIGAMYEYYRRGWDDGLIDRAK